MRKSFVVDYDHVPFAFVLLFVNSQGKSACTFMLRRLLSLFSRFKSQFPAMERLTGTVRNWFDSRGFGFIIPNPLIGQTWCSSDVFVHRNGLVETTKLYPGEQVSFILAWNQRKKDNQAVAVLRVDHHHQQSEGGLVQQDCSNKADEWHSSKSWQDEVTGEGEHSPRPLNQRGVSSDSCWSDAQTPNIQNHRQTQVAQPHKNEVGTQTSVMVLKRPPPLPPHYYSLSVDKHSPLPTFKSPPAVKQPKQTTPEVQLIDSGSVASGSVSVQEATEGLKDGVITARVVVSDASASIVLANMPVVYLIKDDTIPMETLPVPVANPLTPTPLLLPKSPLPPLKCGSVELKEPAGQGQLDELTKQQSSDANSGTSSTKALQGASLGRSNVYASSEVSIGQKLVVNSKAPCPLAKPVPTNPLPVKSRQ
jgi:cold shock CspA family protein